MALNHQEYNKRFVDSVKTSGLPIIDTQKYGIEVVEASNVSEGEMYWRVIGLHHLLPEENGSNHHVYLEVLDENGNRLSPPAWVGWTWEGRQPDERADPACVDKPANEIGTNIAMFKGQRISVWVQGKFREATDKSDVVKGIHIEHADEPLPDGRLLNTFGHHSFYVVYQWGTKTAAKSTPTPGGVATPQPVANPTPSPRNSAISGQVANGNGKTIVVSANGADIERRVIPASGFYRFASLGAGTYTLQVIGTDLKQDVTVNGTEIKVVNLGTVTVSNKPIAHYVLIGPDNKQTNLTLATNYALTFGVTLGFNVAEAKQAQKVTILGTGISAADVQALQAAGSQVEIVTDDISGKLASRIQNGTAFVA